MSLCAIRIKLVNDTQNIRTKVEILFGLVLSQKLQDYLIDHRYLFDQNLGGFIRNHKLSKDANSLSENLWVIGKLIQSYKQRFEVIFVSQKLSDTLLVPQNDG